MSSSENLVGRKKYNQICETAKGENGLYYGYFDKIPRCDKPCGFCEYSEHRGFICPSLMKDHDCIGKNCKHFKKFKDSDFFIETNVKKIEKKLRKKLLNSPRLERLSDVFLASEVRCTECGRVFKRVGSEGVLIYIKRLNKCGWVKSSEDTYVCYKCIRRTDNESCKSILCEHSNGVSSNTSEV